MGAAGFDVTLKQLWLAAAEQVPVGGSLITNPYRSWHEIDPKLPDRPIRIIGPSPGHGTRDAFVEVVMEPACKTATTEMQVYDQQPVPCEKIRTDGRWSDEDNLELILGKLAFRVKV